MRSRHFPPPDGGHSSDPAAGKGVLIPLLLLLLLPMYPLRAADDPRMGRFDVLHYDLSISFDVLHKTFSGSVGVSGVALQESTVIVLSAAEETLVIDSVIQEHARLPFRHEASHLVIQSPEPIAKGDKFSVTVYYHGISRYRGQYDGGGVWMNFAKGYGRIATISEPSFGRTWWPCKDVPNDKATATIRVTVPRTLTAVSNGVLERTETTTELATYTWTTRYPTPTYLIAIAAAKYRHYSDTYVGLTGKKMKISYYVFPEDYEKAKKDFARTAEMLRFLAINYCEYPFLDEKFAFVEVNGSMTMENQTMCTIQDYLITGDRQFESTFFHELAHHWWGNLITTENWMHTWLNEGFATYAEALWAEHHSGQEGYRRFMNNLMGHPNGRYAGSVIGKTDSVFWDSFSDRVYNKGAIILHMLRGVLGDSVFFLSMRDYVNDNRLRYGNAVTDDFIAICERHAGRQLDWFFNQWLYSRSESADRPVYSYSWSPLPAGSTTGVRLLLRQTDNPYDTYTMPLTIAIQTLQERKSFVVIDSLREQTFDFPLRGTATRVDIDPDNWVFKSVQEAGAGR